MATCGAGGRAGTHVNAAGLNVKEGWNEQQCYEGAVHTGNKGVGPLDCCTWYEQLVRSMLHPSNPGTPFSADPAATATTAASVPLT
jgi:hypothetical protein